MDMVTFFVNTSQHFSHIQYTEELKNTSAGFDILDTKIASNNLHGRESKVWCHLVGSDDAD